MPPEPRARRGCGVLVFLFWPSARALIPSNGKNLPTRSEWALRNEERILLIRFVCRPTRSLEQLRWFSGPARVESQ
jgi:hypothetical protein